MSSFWNMYSYIYNERKTWESRLILHYWYYIEIYQVKSFITKLLQGKTIKNVCNFIFCQSFLSHV